MRQFSVAADKPDAGVREPWVGISSTAYLPPVCPWLGRQVI